MPIASSGPSHMPSSGHTLQRHFRRPSVAYLLALLFGLFGFWVVCGDPVSVLRGGLVIDTDYPNAAAAFEIFVRDTWHWPLGENPHFGGINLFFSDGAPWFALLVKGFYSMTHIFIPFHVLTLVNFLLMALMARRLAERVSDSEQVRWLIVALLVFNLIMPVRMIGAQHIALSSYWVVLWAMTTVPLAEEGVRRWQRWEFLAALGLAIWSHAYLGAMAIVIVTTMLLVERRWLAALLALLWPAFLLYVIGALAGEHEPVQGAKAYALDLGAYTKSLGWGITGNLYDIHEPTQGDAIVYLGTGAWFVLLASLGAAIVFRRVSPGVPVLGEGLQRKRLFLVLVASFALMLYAMTFDLRIAGHVWWSSDIPAVFRPLYERFRVTGRFAAPLAFCLILMAALWWGCWCRRIRYWWLVAVVAVALQLADARYAGTLSPPKDWLANADKQRVAVTSVLEDQAWSGRVFKSVGFFELEEQRLLDYLLVEQGARHFEVAHGARLDPKEVERRSGYVSASSGDVVILGNDVPGPECQRQSSIKQFQLCLL